MTSFLTKQPILTAKKIILRPIKNSDAQTIYHATKDKDVIKYTDLPHPFSLKEANKYILEIKKSFKKKESYQFGICLKEKDEFIGLIGLSNVDFKNRKAEIEYWLTKKYWRQGLTTEAMKLMFDFGFKKLKLNRIYAKAMPDNVASRKLLEKSDFVYEGRLRENQLEKNKFIDLLVYSILKKEHFKK